MAWALSADADLGDSHKLGGGGGFFRFSLTQAATVQISMNTAPALMNQALSIYAGQLPSGSHDQDPGDLAANNQFFSYGALLYKASARDMAPNDPQISRFIPTGFNPDGPILDANGFPVEVENPIGNQPDATLGGVSPADWNAANYASHNGYRDTLNFTTQGVLRFDPACGWVPNNTSIRSTDRPKGCQDSLPPSAIGACPTAMGTGARCFNILPALRPVKGRTVCLPHGRVS